MVMMDTNSYYKWEGIEACRKDMLRDSRVIYFVDYGRSRSELMDATLMDNGRCAIGQRRVCDIARRSLTKRKYAEMLFRLVNWLGGGKMDAALLDAALMDNGRSQSELMDTSRGAEKGLTIVELGTSLGVTTAYLAAADSRNKVVTFEGCEAVATIAKENWKRLNISNIECVVGELGVDSLQLTVDSLRGIDVAFIDANHAYASTCEYFNVLADMTHEKSVIVVDDIHYSEEMERAWKEICGDERVTSTIDLYQMGLVFFDKHYWKRNYKMSL